MSLYDSFDYMTKQRGVIWLGPTGCGKTGLATAFLLQAIDRGYRGYFITFPELIQELFQSLADRSDRQVFRRYLSYDCLVIDEVGYVEVEPAQVGQFFTLMHKRHQRKTTIITSNLGFGEWGSFLKNPQLDGGLERSADLQQSRHQHERLRKSARPHRPVIGHAIDPLRHRGVRSVRNRAMTRDDFRRQADLVREIPLEVVLTSWGAVRDRQDKSRWHTPRGPLSVTGTKFFNWHARQGGGGAIDLVMHLGGWDARQAIGWLERHLGGHVAGANPTATHTDAVRLRTGSHFSAPPPLRRRSTPPVTRQLRCLPRVVRVTHNSTCRRRASRTSHECVATSPSSVVCPRRSWRR